MTTAFLWDLENVRYQNEIHKHDRQFSQQLVCDYEIYCDRVQNDHRQNIKPATLTWLCQTHDRRENIYLQQEKRQKSSADINRQSSVEVNGAADLTQRSLYG